MVEKYLKELLYQSDCVIIPGLGGFLCSYAGAEMSVSKNKLTPPYKKIVFNEKISSDDNQLKKYIQKSEDKTIQEIDSEINAYVQYIREMLASKQQVAIEQLGRLYINPDNAVSFEQFIKFNYLIDSYGLPDLYFKPIDRTRDVKQIFNPKKRNPMASNYTNQYEDDEEDEIENRYEDDDESEELDIDEFSRQKREKKTESLALYYVMAIVALMLTAGTAYYLSMDKETYAVGSFNPLAFFKGEKSTDSTQGENLENKLLPNGQEETANASGDTPAESTETSTAPSAQEETAKNYSPSAEYEVGSETGRYFIIAGGFKNKRKAASLRDKLEQDGLSAKIIMPYDDGNVYRVSLGDYDTYEEAKKQKEQLIGTYGEELWVLTY